MKKLKFLLYCLVVIAVTAFVVTVMLDFMSSDDKVNYEESSGSND